MIIMDHIGDFYGHIDEGIVNNNGDNNNNNNNNNINNNNNDIKHK